MEIIIIAQSHAMIINAFLSWQLDFRHVLKKRQQASKGRNLNTKYYCQIFNFDFSIIGFCMKYCVFVKKKGTGPLKVGKRAASAGPFVPRWQEI
jgi:hypothetical protein